MICPHEGALAQRNKVLSCNWVLKLKCVYSFSSSFQCCSQFKWPSYNDTEATAWLLFFLRCVFLGCRNEMDYSVITNNSLTPVISLNSGHLQHNIPTVFHLTFFFWLNISKKKSGILTEPLTSSEDTSRTIRYKKKEEEWLIKQIEHEMMQCATNNVTIKPQCKAWTNRRLTSKHW